MTRSDLLIELRRVQDGNGDKDKLIDCMYNKIEDVYAILFIMEKHPNFEEFAKFLREILER